MRAAAPQAISKRSIHCAFTRKMETYGQDERYRCEPLSQQMHRFWDGWRWHVRRVRVCD
jgi:hypothetical protein